MRRSLLRILLLALLLGDLFVGMSQTQAATIAIDFNDGTQNTPIGAFYSGLGVIFQNGQWQNALLPPFDGINDQLGASLPFVLNAVNTASGFSSVIDEAHAIIGTFSTPVDALSILAGDVGVNGARINAYDAPVGGNLIGFDEFFGVGAGNGNFGTLTVNTPGIRRFELFQPTNPIISGDGLWFDDLSFTSASTPIPEPSTYLLFASGICGVLVYRWQRSKNIF